MLPYLVLAPERQLMLAEALTFALQQKTYVQPSLLKKKIIHI